MPFICPIVSASPFPSLGVTFCWQSPKSTNIFPCNSVIRCYHWYGGPVGLHPIFSDDIFPSNIPLRLFNWSPLPFTYKAFVVKSESFDHQFFFFCSSYGVPVYKIKSFWHQIALPKRTFPHPRHAYCWLKSISKPIDLLFHFSRDGNERHEGSGNLSSSLLTSVSLSPIDKYCFFQGDNLFTIVNCYLPKSFYHSA